MCARSTLTWRLGYVSAPEWSQALYFLSGQLVWLVHHAHIVRDPCDANSSQSYYFPGYRMPPGSAQHAPVATHLPPNCTPSDAPHVLCRQNSLGTAKYLVPARLAPTAHVLVFTTACHNIPDSTLIQHRCVSHESLTGIWRNVAGHAVYRLVDHRSCRVG